MVSKAAEKLRKVSAITLPTSFDDRISLWIFRRTLNVKWNFLCADWKGFGVFEPLICELSRLATSSSRTLDYDWALAANLPCCPCQVCAGFFKRGETWTVLKCAGKATSGSNMLTIRVMWVSWIASVQYYTELVRIGPIYKSDDLQVAIKTRRCTSSSVTDVKLRNSARMSGGLVTLGYDPEGKEKRMTEDFIYEHGTLYSDRISIDQWSGSCNNAGILMKDLHSDWWSP